MVRRDVDDIIEAVLVCRARACQREFPIIDGIPILVADIPQFLSDYEGPLLAREDLSAFTQSLFADSLPTDSSFSYNRSTLSSYACTHYELASGLPALLAESLPLLSSPPKGAWLDVGCATAGGCFELAARGADHVLGIDLNIAMLRFARVLLREGTATYQRRVAGVVYEERTITVAEEHRSKVEVWACSATALPFYDGLFDGALSCNVVDSVDVPIFHLAETGRVMKNGGEAIFASPYDWSTTVTALPRWIGGHSQRSDSRGNSSDEMRRLLSDASPEEMSIALRLIREKDPVTWQVYLHERSMMSYQTHVIVAAKPASPVTTNPEPTA